MLCLTGRMTRERACTSPRLPVCEVEFVWRAACLAFGFGCSQWCLVCLGIIEISSPHALMLMVRSSTPARLICVCMCVCMFSVHAFLEGCAAGMGGCSVTALQASSRCYVLPPSCPCKSVAYGFSRLCKPTRPMHHPSIREGCWRGPRHTNRAPYVFVSPAAIVLRHREQAMHRVVCHPCESRDFIGH